MRKYRQDQERKDQENRD
jgi:hypothetical protein